MIKRINLKEMNELRDINELYFGAFLCREDTDTKLEFIFDFTELNQAEQKGWSCHINQLQNRLFCEYKDIVKYMKHISEQCCKQYKYTYEFYTKEEYKRVKFKRDLKCALEIIGWFLFLGIIVLTKNKGLW